MPAYLVARVDVHDMEQYKQYTALSPAAIGAFGGEFIVRGGRYAGVEGASRERNVVIEFPDYDAALACYNSPEYAAAREIRQAIADGEITVVEGV